jgi:hypothetical protein
LGNNLFQYALGRVVAETNALALACSRHQSAPAAGASSANRELLGLEDCVDAFADVPMQLPGAHVNAPTLSYETWPNSPWRGHRLDLGHVLAPPGARVRLRGYFQRFEYYAPYMPRIRRWYELARPGTNLSLTSPDVVVNIRRGSDFGQRGWVLPVTYYSTLLRSLPDIGTVFVCGRGVDDEIVEGLASWSPVYQSGGPMTDFAMMVSASRLVLSNSTFAWWAAVLSHASEIYAPRTQDPFRFAFTGYRDVDLHPHEARYKEVVVRWRH